MASPILIPKSPIPPEFQAEVVAALLRSEPVAAKFFGVIEPEMFDHPVHRLLVEIFLEYFLRFGQLPSKAVVEKEIVAVIRSSEQVLPQDAIWAEVARIYGLLLPPLDYLTEKLSAFLLRRKLLDLSKKAEEASRQDRPSTESLFREIEAIYSVEGASLRSNYEFLLRDVDRRERLQTNGDKIRTGLPTFDEACGGGVSRGELAVVLAPTGFGKSFWLVFVGAVALRGGHRVVHITLELSKSKTLARYESYFAQIPKREIPSRSDVVVERLKRLRTLLQPSKSDLVVAEFPTRSLSVDELRGFLSHLILIEQFRPDVVIVDYADILKPTSQERFERRYEQLMAIYEGLRGLAQEFQVVLWTGSQATRHSLSKSIVTIADIAESFGKAQVADIIVAICATHDERQANRGRLYIDKNRDNVSHIVIPFKRDFDMSVFTEDGTPHLEALSPSEVPFSDEGETEAVNGSYDSRRDGCSDTDEEIPF